MGWLRCDLDWLSAQDSRASTRRAAISLALLGAGLIASFFHLGRPERAWRTAAMCEPRGVARGYRAAGVDGGVSSTVSPRWRGAAGRACRALGPSYASSCSYAPDDLRGIRFLQEWATRSLSSNTFCWESAPDSRWRRLSARGRARAHRALGTMPLFTLAALLTRSHRSFAMRVSSQIHVQTATGIQTSEGGQKSQGFMGGSFNTREFHRKTPQFLRSVKWISWCSRFRYHHPIGLGLGTASALLLALASSCNTGLIVSVVLLRAGQSPAESLLPDDLLNSSSLWTAHRNLPEEERMKADASTLHAWAQHWEWLNAGAAFRKRPAQTLKIQTAVPLPHSTPGSAQARRHRRRRHVCRRARVRSASRYRHLTGAGLALILYLIASMRPRVVLLKPTRQPRTRGWILRRFAKEKSSRCARWFPLLRNVPTSKTRFERGRGSARGKISAGRGR